MAGCACQLSWMYQGLNCSTYCCNPDNDVGGEWCFMANPATCSDDVYGGHWGYCAPLPDATHAPSPVPSAGPTAAPAPKVESQAWEHFGLINQLRRAGYKCPDGTAFPPNPIDLIFDCRLWKAASLHCQDMIANDYLDSISPLDGSTPSLRAKAQGAQADAENICAAVATAAASLALFEGSAPHCRTLMNATWQSVAVGYAYNSGAVYRYYWTEMFSSVKPSHLDTSCYPPGTSHIQSNAEQQVSHLQAKAGGRHSAPGRRKHPDAPLASASAAQAVGGTLAPAWQQP